MNARAMAADRRSYHESPLDGPRIAKQAIDLCEGKEVQLHTQGTRDEARILLRSGCKR